MSGGGASSTVTLNALIHMMRLEAQDIVSVELRPAAGGEFPAFTAGAHIDLHLPNGLVRSYSLFNAPHERHRYRVAVLRDKASRGGSRCVHEQLRVGATIAISAPRNNFELHEDALHSVLVAGGIGITPLLCMAQRLKQIGKSFELLYLARSAIKALDVPVHWHFDSEAGGPPDLKALLASRARDGTHYYACGPAVMLDAFEAACVSLGYQNAHIERFAAVEVAAASDAKATYTVELKRSGKVVTVTPDLSLLAALTSVGAVPDTSCLEGVCGSCETAVLSGTPDHRDSVLTGAERAAGKTMMVCVSGCKSERLVLDL
jgi:ferredoxin-NADP reductase